MGRFLTPTGGSPRPSRAVVLVLASALSLGVLGSASAAKVFTVCASGCPYTTVTAALAAAANGGVITIGPGTYAGGFTVDKNVTLKGAGAKKTTIRGGDRVITISGNVSASINAVTISGGTGSGIFNGSGIFVGGFFDTGRGMLSLGDSTVSGNAGAGIGGGGAAAISRSTISDNGGAGLFIGFATIENSTVSGNGGFGVGAIYRGGVTITHSTISDNAREGPGVVRRPSRSRGKHDQRNARGGVNNGGFFPMTLRHSVVSGNSATFGGGIWSCCAGESSSSTAR